MKKTLVSLLLALATATICGATDWSASQWLSAADAPVVTGPVVSGNLRAADGASWFVCDIVNDKEVAKAQWTTTALGVYDIYANGKAVGREFLKPGFTHHARTRRSFSYDITGLINPAAGASNRLAAQVTPGWWADKIITPWGHDGMIGRKPAFRGVLEVTYTDGSTRVFGTNTADWRAGVGGPILHASIFDGEEYDARIPMGYDAADNFTMPEVNKEFDGDILPSAGAEVYLLQDKAIAPVKTYVWAEAEGARDGEYGKVKVLRSYTPDQRIDLKAGENLVIDFGQNAAAVPALVFKADAGVKLTIMPSELLNDGNGATSRGMDGPQGSIHRTNLRLHNEGIRAEYTFAGNDEYECYQPTHTFFGYRYLSLGATGDVTIFGIASVPVSSIATGHARGTLRTGNDMVNRLISNTEWGMRSNYLSVPTDCPQRDERLGWTADTQVFAETGTFFANTRDFFHKWMRDMRDTQTDTGAYPGVAPWAQYCSDETMRLGWSDAGIIVPWTVWKQYADTAIVNENWDSMLRYMRHVDDTKYNHQALVAENKNSQWADWLSYEPLETCGGGIYAPEGGLRPDAVAYWNYLSANYWLSDARMMADMARATGRPADEFDAMAARAHKHLADNFINPDGTFRHDIFNTMQTPALFALRNGLVDGHAREAMKARLRQNFADHGDCLQTGFLGTSILMPTLSDAGMNDVAYTLLFQRKNPSWLYSIDNGATTIWERWNSYTLEHGMGPKGMNSFNHYAYGCVCEWLWKKAAGIAADTSAPGFANIIMAPVPDKRLGFVEARYDTPAGTVESNWRYEGDKWIWDFTIPDGATASVTLPGASTPATYPAGKYRIEQ